MNATPLTPLTVTVSCDTGNSWTTKINATMADATDYFLGRRFTRLHRGKEVVDTVTSIERVG